MDTVSYMLGKRAGGGTVVETDPIYSSSPASGITSNDITNWNNKQDTIQVSTMPTASVDNLDKIVQFTGTTDSTYTNGYFYKCVSDGQATPTYSWEEVEVQAGGGGTSYTSGTNISIDSNNAINCSIPYTYYSSLSSFAVGPGNTNLGTSSVVIGRNINGGSGFNSVIIGSGATCTGGNSVAIGETAESNSYSIAIGRAAKATYRSSMAFGWATTTTKTNQAMFGSSSSNINEMAIYTSNGAKVMATEDYVTIAIYELCGLALFSEGKTYFPGDYCYREDFKIYVCITDGAQGQWVDSEWAEKTFVDYLAAI